MPGDSDGSAGGILMGSGSHLGRPASRQPTAPRGVRATAFGLDVRSEIPLPFLSGSTARPTGRVLEISGCDDGTAKLDWPEHAELVCDERQPDGSVIFRIEAHPEAGYLISGPQYGAHFLSADGRRLQCAFPGGRSERRLAAAADRAGAALRRAPARARGLPCQRRRHRGRAQSRSSAPRAPARPRWRSSSAVGEPSFLADDVLALELREDGLLAHPGTPVAGVDHAEARAARTDRGQTAARRSWRSTPASRSCACAGAAEPAPLAALFFLDRRADGPERAALRADRRRPAAARRHLQLRARHARSACAACSRCARSPPAAASSGSSFGPATDASELGAAVEQRLGSSDVTRWLAGHLRSTRSSGLLASGGRTRAPRSRRSSATDRCVWPTAGRRARTRLPLCLLDGFLDNASELSAALELPGDASPEDATRRRLAALGARAAGPHARRLRAAGLGLVSAARACSRATSWACVRCSCTTPPAGCASPARSAICWPSCRGARRPTR